MPTLILSPRYSPDSIAMRKAAFALGWEVERLTSWRCPEDLGASDPVLYGEPLFHAAVAESLGLAILEPTFGWLADLPGIYLKRRVRSGSLADAIGCPRPAFLKPPNDKSFPARVYGPGDPIPAAAFLPPETPALIAEPVRWEVEYRGFLLDRWVACLSPYARDGQLARDDEGDWPAPEDEIVEAVAFASEVLADPDVAIPPAVVLDIGRIEGRGWAVVEANEATGSGIYGCDPTAVLPVLRRACRKAGQLSEDDRRWVVRR